MKKYCGNPKDSELIEIKTADGIGREKARP
jgi:hypothetical protein